MKNSKKDFGNAGQSITEKKSHKHDANLQKNSTLYFQIGLILCLLGTYALFEMQFQEKKLIIDTVETNELATIDVVDKFRVEPDFIPEKKQRQTKQTVLTNKVKVVEDDFVDIKPVDLVISDPKPFTPVKVDDIKVVDTPVDEPIVDFIRIEIAPIYPGCENFKDNTARKKCMSDKIAKLVGKKFNTGLASDYGLTGVQKIQTQFTIDKNGNVVDVKVRAPHTALEKEAKRIIDKIPHMKPGYQRDKAVGVIYNLPITFQVRN
ncbi:energy transducer TonB [Winogradskyella bathintestinalis]|uniref:Energy transducer TonB n=1 Tax=Winogradskyella bathintestinalis TaxID=3035208 RepID=A0ABT7ZZ40_9FLAO|nr:energy transducer TonB [Winogradskyella bathintestinalis]MDN3494156.1 energy transducer TonB [Winogradskyella bathintestinalis]